jgi:squalene-hopene/tetraprenyl-beta-curcumene cyclase
MDWWSTWPNAARDHETFCVSCHSAAPYAMGRPVLRHYLKQTSPSPQEQKLVANVSKRVGLWKEVAPFYPDQTRGLPKSSESRGTESVLNALVLSARDAQTGALADDTRAAFTNMWALQMRTGDLNGAWAWLNFHYEPWESPASPYMGATLAAYAVGQAPGYASSADAKDGVARLREFLNRGFTSQSLFNKLMLVMAASSLDGVITQAQRASVVAEARSLQQSDGGWSLSRFGQWSRVDKTPLDTRSDGLATALAVVALQASGASDPDPVLTKGLDWLRRNQDPKTGQWWASSLNKERAPASDAARFMSDAATAYAVLALTRADLPASPTSQSPKIR